MFHWYFQRITSVLLLPAMGYYGYLLLNPAASLTMVAFGLKVFILATIGYHIVLGLESVIEDYLHNKDAQVVLKVLLILSCIFMVKVLLEIL